MSVLALSLSLCVVSVTNENGTGFNITGDWRDVILSIYVTWAINLSFGGISFLCVCVSVCVRKEKLSSITTSFALFKNSQRHVNLFVIMSVFSVDYFQRSHSV